MTLRIFESTYRELPCMKAVATINRSKKLGISKRVQKTWRAVGEVFKVRRDEVEKAFISQAVRWEKQALERLKNGEQPELKQEEIFIPAQTPTPSDVDQPFPHLESPAQSSSANPTSPAAPPVCG